MHIQEMLTFLTPFCAQSSPASSKPLLVYLPGLNAAPLPPHQYRRVSPHYDIISITDTPDTDWDTLVRNVHSRIPPSQNITLVGESFGAALAIRLAVTTNVSRLMLINPATAIVHQQFLYAITALFPILSIDPTERVLYALAGVFLYSLLVDQSRLDPSCVPRLKSVDIDKVPLDSMLHKVSLLRTFEDSFSTKCYQLVRTPTTLVASAHDSLFDSIDELYRLKSVLPNVDKHVVLVDSAHAALMERDVNLMSLLDGEFGDADQQDYIAAIATGNRIFSPWRSLTSPVLFGTHHISDVINYEGPIVFVGNHTIYGLLDLSVFYLEIMPFLGSRRLSSLVDPIHFDLFSDITGGRWARFVRALGGLLATPRNYYRLLSRGESLLLFPGGAREVCRRRGEKYKLFWKDETDFIRPAAKFNAKIVPFSAMGADDAVDIIVDGQEVQKIGVVGQVIQDFLDERGLSKENLMPVGTIARPERLYFKIHEAIDLANVNPSNPDECRKVYSKIKEIVEGGIDELLIRREKDDERGFARRMMNEFIDRLVEEIEV